MKIKKFNEKHLHEIGDDNKFLENWFNNFLSLYFNENDIYHSEVVYNGDNLSLVIEFDTSKLNSKLFLDISNFLNFFEKNGKYYIFTDSSGTGSEWISIEAIFKKYPDDLDALIQSKRYNL